MGKNNIINNNLLKKKSRDMPLTFEERVVI